jgi:hypothetical protein
MRVGFAGCHVPVDRRQRPDHSDVTLRPQVYV